MDAANFEDLLYQLHRLAEVSTLSDQCNWDRCSLEKLIHQNQMIDEPRWMVCLFKMVLAGESLPDIVRIPAGDPHGDIGLSNLLLDFRDEVVPLDIDEYGEGMRWKIPVTGVVVEIMRETRDNEPLLAIRPLDSDFLAWIVEHLRELGPSKARPFI